MPDGMRDQLKEAAAKNNRSLNAEIVGRLEAHDTISTEMAELVSEVVTSHELTKSLRSTVESLDAALRAEQRITDRLISLLRTRLGATDEEITAATKADDK